MADFNKTLLWQSSLSQQPGDSETNCPRAKLREAYLTFRKRAETLAGEISRSLPEFTVHDISHIDALWQMADLIAGKEITLTPTEAFVFGGTLLVHDLGNGLAAYVDGVDQLKRNSLWSDIVALKLKSRLGRYPTAEEKSQPDYEIEIEAIGELLRKLHASQAEQLAQVSWQDANGNQYWLIDSPELRADFASLIGEIAHSHWWSIDKLASKFREIRGAPGWCPAEWTLDPLKLACLLRIADVIHLDERRAPAFLQSIRKPSNESLKHWHFQGKLNRPIVEGDRLKFTSKSAFEKHEADAWWLCWETLRYADLELHQVDALLQDEKRPYRLIAHNVVGTESPERLNKLIQTKGWAPVNVQVQVTDVAALIQSLGGKELYGEDRIVPLRELLQNACDAVRARRFLMQQRSSVPDTWGEVTVRLGKDENGHFVEVEDNGVGMSSTVLRGPLVDFGKSFWKSSLLNDELPGLASTDFEASGQYGIGFFSVFMWSDRVQVTTRRYEAAQKDTQILEFFGGLGNKPLLREAEPQEYMPDGGTKIRVWLKSAPDASEGFLFSHERKRSWKLAQLCTWLCPSIDANLFVQIGDEDRQLIVGTSDWLTIDGNALLARLTDPMNNVQEASEEALQAKRLSSIINSLRIIKNADGKVVGRAAIIGQDYPLVESSIPAGIITVGGLRSMEIKKAIFGIFKGYSTRASRDKATPMVESSALAVWATEQAQLAFDNILPPTALSQIAHVVRVNEGNTGSLPVALSAEGWLNSEDICAWVGDREEVDLLVSMSWSRGKNIPRPAPFMLLIEGTMIHSVVAASADRQPRLTEYGVWWAQYPRTLLGVVIEALAKAWSSTSEQVLEESTSANQRSFNSHVLFEATNSSFDCYTIRKPRS